MTYIIIFVLLVLLIILSIALIRYHLALKNLSQQIEDKILTGSMKRVGVSIFSKDFLHLYQQIENLFQEVEQSRLVMKREKQTLDMAISNIAHDIRTPLTIASGYTQQLIKSPEDKAETLQKIAQHLDLVSKRLEALLEYRRLIMRTDEELLDRILQNLLGNVLKHGKEEARLSLRKEQEQLVLEIANLVKQPIKRIENLSNRFYSENLSDTEESSGLGLYITEELCHLLGAEMKLSTDGQWLSVCIYF